MECKNNLLLLAKNQLTKIFSNAESPVNKREQQNFTPYWDPDFAESLETWGEGNTWEEIQFLVAGCSGKILDIACGTGKVMEILGKFPWNNIYGCDISDFLIQKAINRGLDKNRLKICDAVKMDYPDNFFEFSYSIGSLEHFTENSIEQCIGECHRVTRKNSFHLVPVSRSGMDEGWITTVQSYYNNTMDWWTGKFSRHYEDIVVLDSRWNDDRSVGKWFICLK